MEIEQFEYKIVIKGDWKGNICNNMEITSLPGYVRTIPQAIASLESVIKTLKEFKP